MKNEEVNPSEEVQELDAKQVSLESKIVRKEIEENVDESCMNDPSNISDVDDDEMIVVLDDAVDFDSISDVRLPSGEGQMDQEVSGEFDDLPEMSVELVDDLPEVEDVEEITSLVEEGEIDLSDGLEDSPVDIVDRVREWTLDNWKPGVLAAVMLFAVSMVISSLWPSASVTENLAAESPKSSHAIVNFEVWVDEILDQHMVGTGTEEK
ncbi:MAG: hypothetical protein VX764_05350 [Planctomycetota bacterium]|nr:hypothetical protein [Planctomycetota bacterium]